MGTLKVANMPLGPLKEMSTEDILKAIEEMKEALRQRAIYENHKKINKFNKLVADQAAFIRQLNSEQLKNFLSLFASTHSTGACLDDSPHKDVIIGGCPCARCTVINMHNGISENTALRFGVVISSNYDS